MKREFVEKYRNEILLLAVLSVFALVYFSNITAFQGLMWDEAKYLELGKNFIQTGQFTFKGEPDPFRPLLYPFTAGVSFILFGFSNLAGKIPVILSTLGSMTAIYWFMKKTGREKEGIISAFLLGIMPLFAVHAVRALTDTFYVFFHLSTIALFYLGIETDRPKTLYLSFFMLGLSFLTRHTASLLLPIMVLYILSKKFLFKEDIKKFFSKKYLVAPLFTFVAYGPYLIRNYLAFGNPLKDWFIIIGKGVVSHGGKAPLPFYQYFIWLPGDITIIATIFAIIGLFYVLNKKDKVGVFAICNLVVILGFFTLRSQKFPRFIASSYPFFAILGAIGVWKVVKPWLDRDIKYNKVVGAILIIILSLAFMEGYSAFKNKSSSVEAVGYPTLKNATDYMSNNVRKGDIIVSSSVPRTVFYTGAKVRNFPNKNRTANSLAELEKILIKNNTKYVVITNYEANQMAKGYVLPMIDYMYDSIFTSNKDVMMLQKESFENESEGKLFYTDSFNANGKEIIPLRPRALRISKNRAVRSQVTIVIPKTEFLSKMQMFKRKNQ